MDARKSNIGFIVAAIVVALISAAAGFGVWRLQHDASAPDLESLKVLPKPRVLADFDLVDQAGGPFSLQNLRGKWSLLFFGFTYCPDICPGTLYDLEQVHQALGESPIVGDDYQVVFVSVDPERDTPERLAEYVSYFDPDFQGVTGAPEQLAPLAMQIGVAYRIEPHEADDANYSVDHSASVFLTDPDGRLYGIFPSPHDPDLMIRDLRAVLD